MMVLKYDPLAVYTLEGRFTGLKDTERPGAQLNIFQWFTVILTETNMCLHIVMVETCIQSCQLCHNVYT